VSEDLSGGEEGGSRHPSDHSSMAAPGPLVGTSAESRSHRVEGEVPSELEQVLVALDGDRMKASLEEMAIELVSMVEPLCVHAVQMLDSGGEIGVGRLHDQVIVVRHQAVAEALPVATPYDAIQQSKKDPDGRDRPGRSPVCGSHGR
jgi:hypothetical protein